jgi:hypothetical protein
MSDLPEISLNSRIHEHLLETAKTASEAMKPTIDAQKDLTKTVISLASATLVFTITFASSFIGPNTPIYWRHAVLACWLAFICSLVLAILSLYFSLELGTFPARVLIDNKRIDAAIDEIASKRPIDMEPLDKIMQSHLRALGKTQRRATRLHKAALISFAIGLLVFTIMGIYRLLAL